MQTTLFHNKYFPYFLFCFLVVLCYSVTLWNGYSFDDNYITENINVLQGIHGIKQIWQSPFIVTDLGTEVDYRPIPLSIYAIEYQFFGKNPAVNHIVSILFYAINVCLLYLVCFRVFALQKIHQYLPILIVSLYCVHPSHVEVVASLKNRDEILNFIFMLITFLFFDKSFKQKTLIKSYLYIICTVFFFYCAVLCKLIALPFMACIFLWSLYAGYYKKWKIFVPMLLCLFLTFTIHMNVFKEYYIYRGPSINFYENPINDHTAINLRLGLGFNSILFYLRFLLVPFPFRFYYGYNVIPFEPVNEPSPSLSLLICIGLSGLFLYSVLKRRSYSYFLAVTLFFLLFYSNIIFLYPGIVSERSMYQFSFFFIAFLLIFIYSRLSTGNNKSVVKTNSLRIKRLFFLYFSAMFIYTGLCIRRSMDWKNELTLKLGDMRYLTESEHANFTTAFTCYTESFQLQDTDATLSGQYADLALYYYNEAIRLAPESDQNYYHIGNLYKYVLNDPENAEINYRTALTKPHTIPENIYQELASLLFVQNRFKEAIPFYEQAVQESPKNIELAFYKVLNLYNAQELQAFLQQNRALQQQYPNEQYAYLNYATYFKSLNQTDSTIYYLEKAVQYGSNSEDVISYIYQYYKQNKDTDKVNFYERLQQKNYGN